MHLNLHLLRVFSAVAEHRSFTRAAETLFISQPAVSKAVRELEHQLELPLLERGAGTKGVQLTESGRALFDHARGIFALERAAVEDVRARVGLQRGRLAVGASTTIAGYWLPPYVATFLARLPSVELQIRAGNTQAISQALIDCTVDVALVEGAVHDERIVATPWRDDELWVVVHPDSALVRKRKVTPVDWNQQSWIIREPGSGTREVAERTLLARGIQPKQTIELGSNEGIARAVAAGLGVAILPARVVRELTRLGEVMALSPRHFPNLVRPLYLLQLKERPHSPLTRAFCDVLQQKLEVP
jgi:LysR family transcriptional regulator, transcriptional activator of the cysJI operon